MIYLFFFNSVSWQKKKEKRNLSFVRLTCSQAFSQETFLTRHSRKSAGVNNKMNDGWIPCNRFSFRVLVARTIVNVISNTCDFSCYNNSKCLLWKRTVLASVRLGWLKTTSSTQATHMITWRRLQTVSWQVAREEWGVKTDNWQTSHHY